MRGPRSSPVLPPPYDLFGESVGDEDTDDPRTSPTLVAEDWHGPAGGAPPEAAPLSGLIQLVDEEHTDPGLRPTEIRLAPRDVELPCAVPPPATAVEAPDHQAVLQRPDAVPHPATAAEAPGERAVTRSEPDKGGRARPEASVEPSLAVHAQEPSPLLIVIGMTVGLGAGVALGWTLAMG